jgi:hypothetical protein
MENKMTKPKIVCLCGSVRFESEWHTAEVVLELMGYIVLSVGFGSFEPSRRTKRELDELHKRRIDLCDWVFVLNVGGYIGRSTRSEIAYALSHNKPVKYMFDL